MKNTYHIFPGCWTYLWNIPVHDRHGDAGAGGWLHATTQDLVHYKTETIHPFGGSGGTALDDDGHVVAWFSDDALQCRHGPGCHPNASSTATVKQDRAAAANAPELGVTMLAAKALDSSLEKWSNTTTQVNVLDTRAAVRLVACACHYNAYLDSCCTYLCRAADSGDDGAVLGELQHTSWRGRLPAVETKGWLLV